MTHRAKRIVQGVSITSLNFGLALAWLWIGNEVVTGFMLAVSGVTAVFTWQWWRS